MSVDTKLALPLHVHHAKIHKVIAKSMGVPMERQLLGPGVSGVYEGDEPCGPGATWSWWVKKEHQEDLKVVMPNGPRVDLSHAWLLVRDPTGFEQRWYLGQESEEELEKPMGRGFNAISIAIGRRLVRFFGGTLQYSDSTDAIDERVDPKKAMYPAPRKGQDSNERFDAFQNALTQVQLLSTRELLSAIDRTGMDPHAEAFLHYLNKVQLEQAVPTAKVAASRPRM